ncbi:MAG: hypothetical protein K940chlam2_01081 [Chlamydiae bacterium]|nr:hypothetical protein [Chlamydiota bacterium]
MCGESHVQVAITGQKHSLLLKEDFRDFIWIASYTLQTGLRECGAAPRIFDGLQSSTRQRIFHHIPPAPLHGREQMEWQWKAKKLQ